MREHVLVQHNSEFVKAARVVGAGEWRIMFRHVVPNALTPVLIQAALAIPGSSWPRPPPDISGSE